MVEAIAFRGELERGDDGFVDLFGCPAADGAAVMQQDFEKADDPGVMDFDAGVTNRTDVDGQGDPLQQRKIHMDVQALRLEVGEPVGDGLEPFANGIEMIKSFLEAEVAQVVGTEFVAQETGELLVLLEERMLPVRPENVMTMLDLIDDGGQFSAQSLIQPDAKDLADAVRRETPQTDLAAPLEDFVDWKATFENEVESVIYLRDRIEP